MVCVCGFFPFPDCLRAGGITFVGSFEKVIYLWGRPVSTGIRGRMCMQAHGMRALTTIPKPLLGNSYAMAA